MAARKSRATVTVAEYLIQRLEEFGARHVFTVPGDYAGPFVSAMDHAEGITRVGTTSELVAGYAADAYARLRGAGAACLTYGVGTFCVLNALAGSYVEQLPVILIIGSPTRGNRRVERTEGVLYHHSTGTLTADADSVQNVVVARAVIRDGKTAPRKIDAAIEEAMRWRRPAYIEVLQNAWSQPCAAPSKPLRRRPLPIAREALARALDETVKKLRGAKTPVIWAGLEVQRLGLQDELLDVLRATGLSYATDLIGKGVLPETTPGFVGVYDGASATKALRILLETSDCVLGFGNLVTDDFLDLIQKNYGNMVLGWNNNVRVGKRTHRDVPLAAFMTGLLERLRDEGYHAPPRAEGRLMAMPSFAKRARLRFPKAAANLLASPTQVTYERFFDRMKTWVDESMVLMADTSIVLYSAAELPVNARDGFLAQAAWNSIGYTPGGALGAGYGDPARRPVVFVGDGGFQMTVQALSDIVRAKHGTIVFIFNNALYGIEQAFVNVKFFTQNEPPEAFDILHAWDYARLVDVFRGGWSATVTTMDELEAALETAKANTGTLSVIDLRIPEHDITPQMLALAQPGGG
ncbi:MAG TPA: thiamine pyrophosphate-binding protein [Gemmatimonadaceae bacterium]|nr:thiamine pyrophosphate-binding protein [Gemmatimonadaceae bacterium]